MRLAFSWFGTTESSKTESSKPENKGRRRKTGKSQIRRIKFRTNPKYKYQCLNGFEL